MDEVARGVTDPGVGSGDWLGCRGQSRKCALSGRNLFRPRYTYREVPSSSNRRSNSRQASPRRRKSNPSMTRRVRQSNDKARPTMPTRSFGSIPTKVRSVISAPSNGRITPWYRWPTRRAVVRRCQIPSSSRQIQYARMVPVANSGARPLATSIESRVGLDDAGDRSGGALAQPPATKTRLSANAVLSTRIRTFSCPTSKMSHGGSGRASCWARCCKTKLHLEITSEARGVNAPDVGSGDWLAL